MLSSNTNFQSIQSSKAWHILATIDRILEVMNGTNNLNGAQYIDRIEKGIEFKCQALDKSTMDEGGEHPEGEYTGMNRCEK